MTSIERELIGKISHLNEDKQRKVLEFVESIEEAPEEKHYTAQELMKLPFEERNRIAMLAIERSQNEDFEIFEAYSEEDIDLFEACDPLDFDDELD